MEDLAGKVAVVTGGASGIGAALCRSAAAAGMQVVVADVEGTAAESVAGALRAQGSRALAAAVDVRSAKELAALAERTRSELGGCDLLVNNAGVIVFKSVHELDARDWEWVLSVNLFGVIHGVTAFLPQLRERARTGGGAHIVNTASVAGLHALDELAVSPYVTSKFGVVGLSESLRRELAADGIGVSVLCPGGVRTRISEAERNRPAELRTGDAPGPEIPRPASPAADTAVEDTSREALEPEEVASLVLEAVRRDDPYVITHPAWKSRVRGRHEAIERAFDEAAERRQR